MSDGRSRRAVVFEAPRRVMVVEEPAPRPAAGEVLVETSVSAISAGTELLIYRGEAPADLAADASIAALAGDLRLPLRYGYSAVGKVIETGGGVEDGDRWLGRRVFAFQPHQSLFTASTADLHPIPDDVADDDAVFLPNVETAVNLLLDGKPLVGERVAVFGLGVVGQLTTALLARLPLDALVTADGIESRRRLALASGAGAAPDPAAAGFAEQMIRALDPAARDAGGRSGADLVYELSGNPTALDQALSVTGYGGRVVVGSWYGSKRASLDLGGAFHRSRITIVPSQVSTLAPELSARWTKSRRIEVAWDRLRELKPSRLVSHRLTLSDASRAYELLDRQPDQALQVLLSYGE